MRLLSPARALATALGVAALATFAASPAAAQTSPTSFAPAAPVTAARAATPTADRWTGVFRIEARHGGETVPMRVIVERAAGRLDGTVLIDSQAAALDKVTGDEDELRAVMVTSDGRGELVLRPTATGVTGTLRVGKTTWRVSGERSA